MSVVRISDTALVSGSRSPLRRRERPGYSSIISFVLLLPNPRRVGSERDAITSYHINARQALVQIEQPVGEGVRREARRNLLGGDRVFGFHDIDLALARQVEDLHLLVHLVSVAGHRHAVDEQRRVLVGIHTLEAAAHQRDLNFYLATLCRLNFLTVTPN